MDLSQNALLEIAGGDCSGLTGTVCDIAQQLRSRILNKINQAVCCSDPMMLVEVNGTKVDFIGYVAAMQKLLQWTYDICRQEQESDGPDVVITSAYELVYSYCGIPITGACGTTMGGCSSTTSSKSSSCSCDIPSDMMRWKGVYNPTNNEPALVNGGGKYGDTFFVPSGAVGTVDFGSGPVTIAGPALLIHNGAAYMVYQTALRLTLEQASDVANQVYGLVTGEILEGVRLIRSRIVAANNGSTLYPGFTYSMVAGSTVSLAPGTAYGDVIAFFMSTSGSCTVTGFGTLTDPHKRTFLYWNGTNWVQLDVGGGGGGGSADIMGEAITILAGDIVNGYVTPLNLLSTTDETFVALAKGPDLTPTVDYDVTGSGTRITFTPSCLSRLIAGDQVYVRRLVT